MIPATSYDDVDNYSINISSYTIPENYFNYLNYKVSQTPTQNQFLYSSQITKKQFEQSIHVNI